MKTLINILIKKKLKLSFAESCTGGMLASKITSFSGASKAVSYECCLAMVNNLSKISKANINVSITGIAGPNGGTKQKPVGLVYIGVKKGNKTQVIKCLFKNKKRSSIQKATVKKALDLIIRFTK